LSSEKGSHVVSPLRYQRFFAIDSEHRNGVTTAMYYGNWFFTGFFFGFTGYFCRPARGLVC